MTIRPFQPRDRTAVHRITLACFEPVSLFASAQRSFGLFRGKGWQALKTEQIDGDCRANPEGVLVAVDGGQVLGYVTTYLDPATGIGHIPNLAVDPAHQGRGIGRQLLQAVLEYFAREGMTHAKIETLEGNEAAQRLYEGVGFREIGRQIHYLMELPPADGGPAA